MKAKYTIHIICCTLLVLLFTSCDDYLDVKPKGKMIPTEVVDFDHLLDHESYVTGFFLDNNKGSLLNYLSDNIELSEYLGKYGYVATNSPNLNRYKAYTFNQPYSSPNANDPFWNNHYKGMLYLNSVIEGVAEVDNPLTVEYGKEVTAQALASRAFSYFIMSMVYGPVYKPGATNTAQTVPYVISPDLSSAMPELATQDQLFKEVLNSCHSALKSTPASTKWPSRPGKEAVQTMLAYYHMFTRQYDSVVIYANAAWTSASARGVDNLIYNYNDFSWQKPGDIINSEIVSPDNLLMQPNHREILLYRTSEESTRGTSIVNYPSQEFIDLFDAPNDLRYEFGLLTRPGYKTTIGGVTYDDGARIVYYRDTKTTMTGGFSYPELLLMRAEGYARTGQLGSAIDDLNTLRKYRYKTGTPQLSVGGLSQDQVIQLVLDERRRELPLGTYKRFLDLKRFSLESGKSWAKTEIVHAMGSETFRAQVDSPFFVLPISNIILQHNPQWNIPEDNTPWP